MRIQEAIGYEMDAKEWVRIRVKEIKETVQFNGTIPIASSVKPSSDKFLKLLYQDLGETFNVVDKNLLGAVDLMAK